MSEKTPTAVKVEDIQRAIEIVEKRENQSQNYVAISLKETPSEGGSDFNVFGWDPMLRMLRRLAYLEEQEVLRETEDEQITIF